MNHCISLQEFSSEAIHDLVETALAIKREPHRYAEALRGRWLLMLFQKTSTRTRLSFEIGMQNLGGRTVVMDWDTSNFAISPIRYESAYVARHVDLIMARLKHHEDLLELAGHAAVPVINGCDDRFHPCQGLADLVTIREAAGGFRGQTLAYVGAHNNVANSLALGCARAGVHLILVTPIENRPACDPEMVAGLERTGALERTLDLAEAVRRADFVYTDTWVDMEFFHDERFRGEKEARVDRMMPYQLNRETLAGSDARILHDMPIHPGYEIGEELIEDPRSLIYAQAENRLYAQQALMLYLLGIPAA